METLIDNKEERVSLLNFFGKLKKGMASEVQILALRPKYTPTVESNFEGDFDFMVAKQDFERVVNIIYDLCKKQGINFTLDQRALNKKRFEFFVLNKKGPCLILEFWTAIEFTHNNKKKSFPAKSIFDTLNKNKITKVEILSLIYITHLFHKDKNIFSEENRYRFEVFLQDLSGKKLKLNDEIPKLLEKLQNKTLCIEYANKRAIGLLMHYGNENSRNANLKIKVLSKRVWNKIFQLKRLVPIVGPDGVGKGSVSKKGLAELDGWLSWRFKSFYRINKLYAYIFYKFMALLFFSFGQDRNKLDERLSYYIFGTSFFASRISLLFRPTKGVLLDRYFTDYLGTPIRYLDNNRYPKKIGLYKLLFFLTPVPKNMIFLGCTDASLITRKNELPLISVDFLQQLYCEFIVDKEIPQVLFISTENPIHISSAILSDFLDKVD